MKTEKNAKFWNLLINYDNSEIEVHERSLGSALYSCILALRRAKRHFHASMRSGPVAIDDTRLGDIVNALHDLHKCSPKFIAHLLGVEAEGPATYGTVCWTPNDIKTLRPRWSIAECAKFLGENEKWIQERLGELGWDVIRDLLPRK